MNEERTARHDSSLLARISVSEYFLIILPFTFSSPRWSQKDNGTRHAPKMCVCVCAMIGSHQARVGHGSEPAQNGPIEKKRMRVRTVGENKLENTEKPYVRGERVHLNLKRRLRYRHTVHCPFLVCQYSRGGIPYRLCRVRKDRSRRAPNGDVAGPSG
jgi:hypothetical protein